MRVWICARVSVACVRAFVRPYVRSCVCVCMLKDYKYDSSLARRQLCAIISSHILVSRNYNHCGFIIKNTSELKYVNVQKHNWTLYLVSESINAVRNKTGHTPCHTLTHFAEHCITSKMVIFSQGYRNIQFCAQYQNKSFLWTFCYNTWPNLFCSLY